MTENALDFEAVVGWSSSTLHKVNHVTTTNKDSKLVGREPGYAAVGAGSPSLTEPSTATSLALLDIADGLRHWRLWGVLGWQDIKQRYRRSVLGPFWLTLSMGTLVGALGFLYGALFRIAIDDYLPFLALGFLAWVLISGIVSDGCTAFIDAEKFIKQMKLPYSTFVYRVVWRNLIVFAHNFVIYVVVAIVFGIWAGATGLLLLPGLALIVANGLWVCLLVGMVCARFRDVPQIVASLIRITFFMTPIIWKPEQLGKRSGLVDFNPFYHFIEMVRAPLLGQVPSRLTWTVGLAVAGVGWLVTYLFWRRFRSRISYWV